MDHFTRYAYIRTSSTQRTDDFVKLIRPTVERENVELLLADQYTGINADKLKRFLSGRKVKILFTEWFE